MSFFDNNRSRFADEDIVRCYECAEEAGIRDNLFLGFGGLLGAIRHGSYIPHDSDIDMCLKADEITQEQERHYYNLLCKDDLVPFRPKAPWVDIAELPQAGMFRARRKYSRREDTGRLTWFSLRKDAGHAKFCHWLGFQWNGYWWHTKSGLWVKERKFSKAKFGYDNGTDAIMKGIPAEYVDELCEIDFRGIKINVPRMYGACLDFWYPGWKIPKKGGTSAKTIIGIVPDWSNQSKWKVSTA